MSWISKNISASNISMTEWKDITAEGVLKEILESEETELANDLKIVLNYLRGHLEKIMDSPELILEIDMLKKEISELKRENQTLRNNMISVNNELGNIKKDNIMLYQKCNMLKAMIDDLFEKLT